MKSHRNAAGICGICGVHPCQCEALSRTTKGLYQDFVRKTPLREEDYMNVPDQREPLFPREILQPIYEEWKRFHATSDSAEQFFNYLLRQSKK